MVKVLGRAGTSLADVYDVEGSIAGVDQIITEEVGLVQEMGAVIQSERLNSFTEVLTTGAILQATPWDVAGGALPDCVARVLGVVVITDNADAVGHCQLSVMGPGVSGEFPFWNWNSADDGVQSLRLTIKGGAPGNLIMLRPAIASEPFQQIVARMGDEMAMPTFFFRGTTAGFGAGTRTTQAIVYFARPSPGVQVPGTPSSHGLPIPSW